MVLVLYPEEILRAEFCIVSSLLRVDCEADWYIAAAYSSFGVIYF
jgi:hypothetical protein